MSKGQEAKMDGYATHLPALVFAAQLAVHEFPTLPFIELGCGHYSTRILQAFGMHVDVVSTDQEWGAQFEDDSGIEMHYIDSWVPKPFPLPHYHKFVPQQGSRGWGLCMLDNEELVVDRIKNLPVLLQLCRLVVMHDWREELKVPDCLGHVIYKKYRPWTIVMSRYLNLNFEDAFITTHL